MYVGVSTDSPPPRGSLPPDPPTPKVCPPPPLQPPNLSHTPRGHTLVGGSPSDYTQHLYMKRKPWDSDLGRHVESNTVSHSCAPLVSSKHPIC